MQVLGVKYKTANVDGVERIVYKRIGQPLYAVVVKFTPRAVHLRNIDYPHDIFYVPPLEFKKEWRACLKRGL